jgi:colanic acid biosynthesis glycosyl transferase WcaI
MASVSDGGDVPKILNETGCGVVVDPSDPKAMADAIQELTGKPELLKNMGKAGRKYAEANYSKPHLLQQFIDKISI